MPVHGNLGLAHDTTASWVAGAQSRGDDVVPIAAIGRHALYGVMAVRIEALTRWIDPHDSGAAKRLSKALCQHAARRCVDQLDARGDELIELGRGRARIGLARG